MVDDIILYEASQVGFDKIGSTSSDPDERLSLGIGVLFDTISCEVYEELNGEFELEMTYPISGQLYSEIQNGRIIVAKPNPYVRPQPFRIYNITKPIDGIVTIKGQHITYDMAGMIIYPYEEDAKDGVGHVYRYKTKTAHLQDIKDGDVVTEHGVVSILNFNVNPAYDPDGENPFRIVLGSGWSPTPDDPSETCEFNLEDPTNLRGLMGGSDSGLVKMFKGYWTFDCYTCTFSKTRGSDRGVTFEYGRDITDLEVEDSMGLPYTHVLPYYKNGSDYVYYDGGSSIGDAEESMLIPIEEVSRPHRRILELDLTEEVKYKIDHTPDLTASFQWENLTKYNLLYLYNKAGSSNEGKTRILRRSRSPGTWPNGYYKCERLQMITMPKLNARPQDGKPSYNPYYGEDFADMVRNYEGDAWNVILWAMPVGSCVYIKSGAIITTQYTSTTNRFSKTTIAASGIYMKMEGTATNVITTKPENGAKNTWMLVTTHGNQLTFDDSADDPFAARKMATDDGPQIITDMENPSYDDLKNDPTVRHNWMFAIFALLMEGSTSAAVGGSAWFFAYQGPETSSDLDLVQEALKETADEYITKNHVGGIKTDLRISFYEADGINNYNIELGDTVYISHPNLVGDTMSVTVTRYRYDVIMGRYSELEIGDPNQDSTLSNDISGLGSFYENTTTKKQLASALTQSMRTVNGAIGGCVKIVNSQTDAPDNPDQILIMDKPTVASSTYMWRWNYGGLMAGQKDGNGIWRYGLAMTIDGRIVADRIKVGTLSGINLQFEGEDEQSRPHRFLVNGETGKVTLVNVDLVAYGTSGTDPIFQLSSDGTAMMHGDLLVTGTIKADKIMDRNGELYGGIPQSKLSYDAIKSSNYSYTSTSDPYAVAGSWFDLQNGIIRSKNFAIDEDGNAYFKGEVTATSGEIGGCSISDGVLKVGAANVDQVTVGSSTGKVFADFKSDPTTPYVKIVAKDASNNVIFQLDTTQTGTDMLKVAAANVIGQLTASSILVKDTSDNVIFSANAVDHTVSINGTHIDSGTVTRVQVADDLVKSTNYVSPVAPSKFSQAGTYLNLADGSIFSPHFAIDSNGDAFFSGNISVYADSQDTVPLLSTTSNTVSLAGFRVDRIAQSGGAYYATALRTDQYTTMTSTSFGGMYLGTDGFRICRYVSLDGETVLNDVKIQAADASISASKIDTNRMNLRWVRCSRSSGRYVNPRYTLFDNAGYLLPDETYNAFFVAGYDDNYTPSLARPDVDDVISLTNFRSLISENGRAHLRDATVSAKAVHVGKTGTTDTAASLMSMTSDGLYIATANDGGFFTDGYQYGFCLKVECVPSGTSTNYVRINVYAARRNGAGGRWERLKTTAGSTLANVAYGTHAPSWTFGPSGNAVTKVDPFYTHPEDVTGNF